MDFLVRPIAASRAAAYQAKNPGDIDRLFREIARDLQHLYMIGYYPPPGPTNGKWRTIQVSVEGQKDYRVRAKEGYFARLKFSEHSLFSRAKATWQRNTRCFGVARSGLAP